MAVVNESIAQDQISQQFAIVERVLTVCHCASRQFQFKNIQLKESRKY